MERFCWKGHVNPGKLEEYAAKHNAMCRQMEELMRAAGMRNYSIWANGEDTIGYYEYGRVDKSAIGYSMELRPMALRVLRRLTPGCFRVVRSFTIRFRFNAVAERRQCS